MKFVDVEINGQLFDFVIDEKSTVISKALEYMTSEDLLNTLIRAMHTGGLTYENLEEMNRGGSWCIATKAESVTA